jgi:phage-related protein
MLKMKSLRSISWIKAARKDFEDFPEVVQHDMLTALTVAAEGEKSDNAKPFRGIDAVYLKLLFGIAGKPFALFMP